MAPVSNDNGGNNITRNRDNGKSEPVDLNGTTKHEKGIYDVIADYASKKDFNSLLDYLKGEVPIKSKDQCGWGGQSTLMSALYHGCTRPIIEFLLDSDPRIDAVDSEDKNLLMYAVIGKCSRDVVSFLLDRGAHIDKKDKSQRTVLMRAVSVDKSDTDTVKLLLDNGANVNDKDNKDKTVLMHAINGGSNLEIVKLLCNYGVPLCDKDISGASALLHAVQGGCDLDLLKYLYQKGPNGDVFDLAKAAIRNALEDESRSVIQYLLECMKEDFTLENHGFDLLKCALENKCTVLVLKLLITYGISVNGKDERERTTVMIALEGRCDEQVVLALINNNASLEGCDNQGMTTIMIALCNGYGYDTILLLIRQGASILGRDRRDMCALQHALRERCSYETISLLLDNGALFLSDSRTILKESLQYGVKEDILQLLVLKSAVRDNLDFGAAVLACKNRYTDTIFKMCFLGAHQLIGQNMFGQNAVMIACTHGCETKVVEYLVSMLYSYHMKHGLNTFNEFLNLTDCHGMTSLMLECAFGHRLDCVRYFVTAGANVNVEDQDGFTALMWSIYEPGYIDRKYEIVNWFVSGAYKDGLISQEDINYQNKYGINALMCACYYSKLECVDKLLEVANVNAQERYTGLTALHICIGVDPYVSYMFETHEYPIDLQSEHMDVMKKRPSLKMNRHIECAESILKKGANVNQKDHQGRTPIFLACSIGDIKFVELLLSFEADISINDASDISPCAVACTNGHLDLIRFLFHKGLIDMNSVVDNAGNTLLLAAARLAQYLVMEFLLQHEADVNHQNKARYSALMIICETSADEFDSTDEAHNTTSIDHNIMTMSEQMAVKSLLILIGFRANPHLIDKDGSTALHKACTHGKDFLVQTFMDYAYLEYTYMAGDSTFGNCYYMQDMYGNLPLHNAISSRCMSTSILLLQQMDLKALDKRNNLGMTPLHSLCNLDMPFSRMKEVFEIFCEMEADVENGNITESKPFVTACKIHNIELAEALLHHGANPNATNCLKMSALHEVIQGVHHSTKDIDILSWLIDEQGISVNCQDLFGCTPLHLACRGGKTDAAIFCIQKGADIHITDKCNIVPLAYATAHPDSFRQIVQECQVRDQDIVKCRHDLIMIYKFAKCHNTLSCLDILEDLQMKFDCVMSDLERIRGELPLCDDKFVDHKDWVANFDGLHPDKETYFYQLLTKYGQDVVPCHHERMVKHFMQCFSDLVAQDHPLLAFDIVSSGSVREGTKVVCANEYDYLCQLQHEFAFAGEDGSNKVECILIKLSTKAFSKNTCKECEEIFQLNKPIDRERLVSHFYEVSGISLTATDLWNLHPFIHRLTSADITGANRTISCLEIAIHDPYQDPWLKLTVDIVPALYAPEIPKYCHLPLGMDKRGCLAVGKWFAGQSDNTKLFRLSHCFYHMQMFDCMPDLLKDAYILAKIMQDDRFCPLVQNFHYLKISGLISSHILKVCTLHIFLALKGKRAAAIEVQKCQYVCMNSKKRIVQVANYASKIYQVLCNGLESQGGPYLDFIYVPDYNVLDDDKFSQYREVIVEYLKGLIKILSCELPNGPTFVAKFQQSLVWE